MGAMATIFAADMMRPATGLLQEKNGVAVGGIGLKGG
jgi:hypothetical protein